MRINLAVPFEQKDQAKALGAKWDPARKVWFLIDVEDLTPFARWFPPQTAHKPRKEPRPRVDSKPGVLTRQRSFNKPHCGCHSPPWEDCEHTAEFPLETEQAEHIRAIMGGN